MKKILFVIIPIILFGMLFFYNVENDSYFRADVRNFLIDTGLKSDFTRPYSDSDNKPFSYYATYETISIIQPSNKTSTQNIPLQLIIPIGIYSIHENVYDLKNEGLYRFVFPGVENSQRIVYDGTNIESLLSSVSWIYTHGNSDSGKSFEELNQKAMQSKIYGVCNTISIWILQILQEQNISSRLVQTMTLDEWNTYDNSHTMIEVYRNDLEKWVVYDLDNNVFFTYDEIPLSLVEFVDHVKNNDYDIVFLASDTKLDVSNFKSGDNDYDYAFVAESITSNEDTLRNWYERIIQVPLIQGEDLEFYFFDSKNQIKIENFAPNYHFIEETKFLNDFYG
jgi:hypothetical protein